MFHTLHSLNPCMEFHLIFRVCLPQEDIELIRFWGVSSNNCCHGTTFRCRSATSWSDLELTFHLAVVTLTFHPLSRLYFGNCNAGVPLEANPTTLYYYKAGCKSQGQKSTKKGGKFLGRLQLPDRTWNIHGAGMFYTDLSGNYQDKP